LDHERRDYVQAEVLPARDAARVARQLMHRQPAKAREAALEPRVAARAVCHAERLVKPDREARLEPQDQRMRDAALRLRQRPGAGVLLGSPRPERLPTEGKVAVEV